MSPSCRHCTGLRPINNALRLLLQSDGEDPLVRNSPRSRLPPVKMGGRLSVCHSTPSVGRQVPEYNACWNSRVWVCHQSWQNVDQLYRGHSWWTQGDENWSERSFSLVRVSFGYSHTWSFTGLVPVHRWVLLKEVRGILIPPLSCEVRLIINYLVAHSGSEPPLRIFLQMIFRAEARRQRPKYFVLSHFFIIGAVCKISCTLK